MQSDVVSIIEKHIGCDPRVVGSDILHNTSFNAKDAANLAKNGLFPFCESCYSGIALGKFISENGAGIPVYVDQFYHLQPLLRPGFSGKYIPIYEESDVETILECLAGSERVHVFVEAETPASKSFAVLLEGLWHSKTDLYEHENWKLSKQFCFTSLSISCASPKSMEAIVGPSLVPVFVHGDDSGAELWGDFSCKLIFETWYSKLFEAQTGYGKSGIEFLGTIAQKSEKCCSMFLDAQAGVSSLVEVAGNPSLITEMEELYNAISLLRKDIETQNRLSQHSTGDSEIDNNVARLSGALAVLIEIREKLHRHRLLDTGNAFGRGSITNILAEFSTRNFVEKPTGKLSIQRSISEFFASIIDSLGAAILPDSRRIWLGFSTAVYAIYAHTDSPLGVDFQEAVKQGLTMVLSLDGKFHLEMSKKILGYFESSFGPIMGAYMIDMLNANALEVLWRKKRFDMRDFPLAVAMKDTRAEEQVAFSRVFMELGVFGNVSLDALSAVLFFADQAPSHSIRIQEIQNNFEADPRDMIIFSPTQIMAHQQLPTLLCGETAKTVVLWEGLDTHFPRYVRSRSHGATINIVLGMKSPEQDLTQEWPVNHSVLGCPWLLEALQSIRDLREISGRHVIYVPFGGDFGSYEYQATQIIKKFPSGMLKRYQVYVMSMNVYESDYLRNTLYSIHSLQLKRKADLYIPVLSYVVSSCFSLLESSRLIPWYSNPMTQNIIGIFWELIATTQKKLLRTISKIRPIGKNPLGMEAARAIVAAMSPVYPAMASFIESLARVLELASSGRSPTEAASNILSIFRAMWKEFGLKEVKGDNAAVTSSDFIQFWELQNRTNGTPDVTGAESELMLIPLLSNYERERDKAQYEMKDQMRAVWRLLETQDSRIPPLMVLDPAKEDISKSMPEEEKLFVAYIAIMELERYNKAVDDLSSVQEASEMRKKMLACSETPLENVDSISYDMSYLSWLHGNVEEDFDERIVCHLVKLRQNLKEVLEEDAPAYCISSCLDYNNVLFTINLLYNKLQEDRGYLYCSSTTNIGYDAIITAFYFKDVQLIGATLDEEKDQFVSKNPGALSVIPKLYLCWAPLSTKEDETRMQDVEIMCLNTPSEGKALPLSWRQSFNIWVETYSMSPVQAIVNFESCYHVQSSPSKVEVPSTDS